MEINKKTKYVLRKSKIAKGLCSLAFGVALITGVQTLDENVAKANEEPVTEEVAREEATSETAEEKTKREELVRKYRELEGELARKSPLLELYLDQYNSTGDIYRLEGLKSENEPSYGYEESKNLDDYYRKVSSKLKELEEKLREDYEKYKYTYEVHERTLNYFLVPIIAEKNKLEAEVSELKQELETLSLELDNLGDKKNIAVELSEKEKTEIAKEKNHIENDFLTSAYHNENFELKNGKLVEADVQNYEVEESKWYPYFKNEEEAEKKSKNLVGHKVVNGSVYYFYGMPKSAKDKTKEDFLKGSHSYAFFDSPLGSVGFGIKYFSFEITNKDSLSKEDKDFIDENYYSSMIISYRPINILNHLDEFRHTFRDDNDPNKVYVVKGILLDTEVAVLKELGIDVPKHIKVVTEEEAKAMATVYEGVEKSTNEATSNARVRIRSVKLKHYDWITANELEKQKVNEIVTKFFKENKDSDFKVYDIEIHRPEKLQFGYNRETNTYAREVATEPLVYEAGDKFVVTIKIKKGETPKAVYYYNEKENKVETINITVEGDNLKFTTSHFSKYIVEYEKTENEESTPENPRPNTNNTMNTGSNNTLISEENNDDNNTINKDQKDNKQKDLATEQKTLPKTSAVKTENTSSYGLVSALLGLGLITLASRRKLK